MRVFLPDFVSTPKSHTLDKIKYHRPPHRNSVNMKFLHIGQINTKLSEQQRILNNSKFKQFLNDPIKKPTLYTLHSPQMKTRAKQQQKFPNRIQISIDNQANKRGITAAKDSRQRQRPKTFEFKRRTAQISFLKTNQCSIDQRTRIGNKKLEYKKESKDTYKTLELVRQQLRPWSPAKIQLFYAS